MKSTEILTVVRRGRKLRAPWAIIYVLPAAGQTGQTACVVGKKVDVSAVGRHRYQRWLREVVRPWAAALAAKDVVVVALPAIRGLTSFAQLREGLTPYFQDLANE